jgi:hypothetical protein
MEFYVTPHHRVEPDGAISSHYHFPDNRRIVGKPAFFTSLRMNTANGF